MFEGYTVKTDYEKVKSYKSPVNEGWDFIEEKDMGWYFECIAEFRLQMPLLWGNWDHASFLVGILVGIVLSFVSVISLFYILSKLYPQNIHFK